MLGRAADALVWARAGGRQRRTTSTARGAPTHGMARRRGGASVAGSPLAGRDPRRPIGRATSQALGPRSAAAASAAELEGACAAADGGYRCHRIRFVIAPARRWYGVAADIEAARARGRARRA